MSTRSIESFFTRLGPATQKVTSSSTTTTTTTAVISSTAAPAASFSSSSTSNSTAAVDVAPSASSSESTRKRGSDAVEAESPLEADAENSAPAEKKLKADSASAVPVLSSISSVTSVSSTGSAVSSGSLWSATLPSLLHPTWQAHLRAEFAKPYFARLCASLQAASAKSAIYPPSHLIFEAFNLCPFPSVKVVVLGQDPYHDTDQAEGLAFSVPPPIRPPSSLQNIFKELRTDVGFVPPQHGSLRRWAEQGVLLLNSSLTVSAHQANSHKGYGWEHFTDAVIAALNKDAHGLVFLLWGAHAQKKADRINTGKHHVLKAVHPSGLSANRGFFGCRHFSKCNALLRKEGKAEIDWQL